MIYVCNKTSEDGSVKVVICKAGSSEQAKSMSGIALDSMEWVMFTESQIRTLLDTDEGYLLKTM